MYYHFNERFSYCERPRTALVSNYVGLNVSILHLIVLNTDTPRDSFTWA